MKTDTREKLRAFLAEHADKPDTWEVWGQASRPGAYLTIGQLRELHRELTAPRADAA